MKKVLLAAAFALAGVSLFSCSSSSSDDEPFSMNERAITIQKGDKYTITHTGKASWSSDDDFVASVNDGEVTANHVGETAIYAMSGGSKSQCDVTVRGLYNYFREPLCKLNATPEDVMRYETRSLNTKKSDRTTLIYYPAMNEDIDVVAYTFKNDKLESAFVSIYARKRYASIADDDKLYEREIFRRWYFKRRIRLYECHNNGVGK